MKGAWGERGGGYVSFFFRREGATDKGGARHLTRGPPCCARPLLLCTFDAPVKIRSDQIRSDLLLDLDALGHAEARVALLVLAVHRRAAQAAHGAVAVVVVCVRFRVCVCVCVWERSERGARDVDGSGAGAALAQTAVGAHAWSRSHNQMTCLRCLGSRSKVKIINSPLLDLERRERAVGVERRRRGDRLGADAVGGG